MAVGKRIFLKRNLPDIVLVKKFEKFANANIADVTNRNIAMHSRIKLISKPIKSITSGIALTVKSRLGDNLALHAALNIAKENDIIIVSNEAGDSRAVMGEIIANFLISKKVTGIVIDGPIRDYSELKNMNLPIYATGFCPSGPYKDGPGEVNTPISCGNIIVNPGDIINLDEDGVIVIPKKDASLILESVSKYSKIDQQKVELAKTGKQNRQWVNELLELKEFEIINDIYSD